MSDTLVLPVPERLLAVYAVATSEHLNDITPHSEGGVAVDVVPVDDAPLPPAALLRAMGASPQALTKLGSASWALLVRSVGSPAFPPAHELTAYAAAQTICDVYDGVLVDTVIPRVVQSPRGLDELFRLSDWFVLPHSADDDGTLWFTTKGLSRFGLPELQSRGVPERAVNAWGAVLTGVAQVLTTRLGELLSAQDSPAFVELPVELEVSLRDIAAGYSDRSRAGVDPDLDVPVAVGVAWDPATREGADSFLSVQPPAAHQGGVDAWVNDAVTTLFGNQV